MSTFRTVASLLSVGLLLVALTACENPTYPTQPKPTIRANEPLPGVIDLNPGDVQTFYVDGEYQGEPVGHPYRYSWFVNGEKVAWGRRYTFQADSVGEYFVKAEVEADLLEADSRWLLRVYPDTIPPGPIPVFDMRLRGWMMEFRFEAPGDDGDVGRARGYDIRWARAPMTEEMWGDAGRLPTRPPALLAGSDEVVTIPWFDGRFWVAVRAVDEAGNLSPWTDSFEAPVVTFPVSGSLVDPLTGRSLAGWSALLSDDGGLLEETMSDDRGVFGFTERDASGERFTLDLRDEDVEGDIGDWYDIRQTFTNSLPRDQEWVALPHLPLETTVWDHFLAYAKHMVDFEYAPRVRRWQRFPIPIYVGEFTHSDTSWTETLDWDDAVREAIGWWEEATGLDLFVEVSGVPAVGVEVKYIDMEPPTLGEVHIRAWENQSVMANALVELQRRFGSPAGYRWAPLVAAHELGHVLGLFEHSSDPGHVMAQVGITQNDYVSADEGALVHLLYRLPPGLSLTPYADD